MRMIKAPTPPSVASELSARRRLRLTNAVPSHGNRRLGTGVNPECGGVETDPSTARLGGRTRVGPTRSGERLGNCSRGPATSACSPADRDGRGPHAAPALSRRRASSRSDREIGRWLAGASLEATCSWTSSTPCSPRRSAVRPRAAGVHPRRGARNVKDFFGFFVADHHAQIAMGEANLTGKLSMIACKSAARSASSSFKRSVMSSVLEIQAPSGIGREWVANTRPSSADGRSGTAD